MPANPEKLDPKPICAQVKVNFAGWPSKWDEWLDCSGPRIRDIQHPEVTRIRRDGTPIWPKKKEEKEVVVEEDGMEEDDGGGMEEAPVMSREEQRALERIRQREVRHFLTIDAGQFLTIYAGQFSTIYAGQLFSRAPFWGGLFHLKSPPEPSDYLGS